MTRLYLISHKAVVPRIYHTISAKYTSFEVSGEANEVLKHCVNVHNRQECEIVGVDIGEFAYQHVSNIGFNVCKFDRSRKSITVVNAANVEIEDDIMIPHVRNLLENSC
jgi:hypothetical protein